MQNKLESFKWWCMAVRGLYSHVWLIKEMHKVLDQHRPYSEAGMKQIRDQQAMIGLCLLKVLCVYKNQDDGFT